LVAGAVKNRIPPVRKGQASQSEENLATQRNIQISRIVDISGVET
jgi:hypothetical protein